MKIKTVLTYQPVSFRGSQLTFFSSLPNIPGNPACKMELLTFGAVRISTFEGERIESSIVVPFANVKVIEEIVEVEAEKFSKNRTKIMNETSTAKLQDVPNGSK